LDTSKYEALCNDVRKFATIFQFLWVWNDFLAALVFLGKAPEHIVLTIKLDDLLGPRGKSGKF